MSNKKNEPKDTETKAEKPAKKLEHKEGKKLEPKVETKIIRIAKVDLRGNQKVINALRGIKGVGFMFSNAIIQSLKINPNTLIADLSDDQLDLIKKALENPTSIGVPQWLFNRRFDPETGEFKHLIGPDIALQLRFDIKRVQSTKSYKGLRHGLGLKVRGQRTKSHPRRGSAMGVKKKKAAPAKKGEGEKK